MNIVPPDIYDFEVVYCNAEYVSNAGKRSLHVKLEIIDPADTPHQVKVYFSYENYRDTGRPHEIVTRTKNEFLTSIAKKDLIGKEIFNNDLLGAKGRVAIKTEKSDNFPPALRAARFISPTAEQALNLIKRSVNEAPEKAPAHEDKDLSFLDKDAPFIDDDIPF